MNLIYRHSHKTKRITIKVKPDGQVEIVSPPKTSKSKLDKFVANNAAWIKAQLKKLKKRQEFIESDQHLLLFGQNFKKKVINNLSLKLGIHTNQDQLIINLPDKKLMSNELELFVKKTARQYIPQRTQQLAQTMSVEFNQLRLKNQQTLWGQLFQQKQLEFQLALDSL